jgi:hypothetical protein
MRIVYIVIAQDLGPGVAALHDRQVSPDQEKDNRRTRTMFIVVMLALIIVLGAFFIGMMVVGFWAAFGCTRVRSLFAVGDRARTHASEQIAWTLAAGMLASD